MNQLRLLKLLLLPSLLSWLVSGTLALLVLGVANWVYFARSPSLYGFFFGPTGFVTVLQNTPNNLAAMAETVFNAPWAYQAVIMVIAILAGLLVYILLEGFDHAVLGAADVLQDIQYSDPQGKRAVEREVSARLAVRSISLVGWVAYWLLFVQVLVPFCILTTRITIDELSSWTGWAKIILGAGLLLVGIHLHTVFARLVTLRPRLFGGRAVLEVEMEQEHP